jgi:hypothetical protein
MQALETSMDNQRTTEPSTGVADPQGMKRVSIA